MQPASARLAIQALNKTFGSSRVLRDVEFSVAAGEIHGLAGQNGSGKSTLIKILTGLYTPDAGARYEVDGRSMRLPARWPEVHAAGVSVVHQDLGLLDHLSVAENVCVGGFPTTGILRRIDRGRRDGLTVETLSRLGLDISPDALVETLGAPERAEVAIARAMRDHTSGTGLVILDESTRALSGEELIRIHGLLRRIAADGGSVLLISHNLVELMDVTDRITILRDGRVVGAGLSTGGLTETEIARLMLGSTVAALGPRSAEPPSTRPEPTVTVTGLAGKLVDDVNFSLGSGEILGITGLPGSGYEEIPYLMTGAQRASAGHMKTKAGTVNLARSTVASCMRAGVVLVPERRDRDGLAFEMNVRDNISLPSLRRRGTPWFVARRWQQQAAAEAVETFGIQPNQPSLLIKQLSGGNQQKVLLAKWLSTGPSVLVLHEPTQAVDVGARRDILQSLQRTADSGVAVLLVSSEPEDLVAVCDRVAIYRPSHGLHDVGGTTPEALIDQIYSATNVAAGSST
jgi:ribose transport system ATP-binding protein